MCLPLIMEANMKVERFITEYANACKREIKESNIIGENFRDEVIGKINQAIYLRDRRLITADEAVRMILTRFDNDMFL